MLAIRLAIPVQANPEIATLEDDAPCPSAGSPRRSKTPKTNLGSLRRLCRRALFDGERLDRWLHGATVRPSSCGTRWGQVTSNCGELRDGGLRLVDCGSSKTHHRRTQTVAHRPTVVDNAHQELLSVNCDSGCAGTMCAVGLHRVLLRSNGIASPIGLRLSGRSEAQVTRPAPSTSTG